MLVRIFERNVTKSAPDEAPKLIASGKLTFDERVVLRDVDWPRANAIPPCIHDEYDFWDLRSDIQ